MTPEANIIGGDAQFFDPPAAPRRRIRGEEKLNGVQPELVDHYNNLVDQFTQAGITPELKSGHRTTQQQQALYNNPQTRARTMGNDGVNKISPHQEGRALDFGFAPNQRNAGRAILAHYATENGLTEPKGEPWHITLPKQSGDTQFFDKPQKAATQSDAQFFDQPTPGATTQPTPSKDASILSDEQKRTAVLDASQGLKTPQVSSTVEGGEAPPVKPLTFGSDDLKGQGVGTLGRGAAGLAKQVKYGDLQTPDNHPLLFGKRTTLTFDKPEDVGPDSVADKFLAQYGPEYQELNRQFKAETGQNLVNLNSTASPTKQGDKYSVNVRPTRGSIDAINAYAIGGMKGLQDELAKQHKTIQDVHDQTVQTMKDRQGVTQDVESALAGEAIKTGVYAQNVKDLAMVGGPNYISPENDPTTKQMRLSEGNLPQATTTTGAIASVPIGAAATIGRAASVPLPFVGFPLQQYLENSDQGSEQAIKSAMLAAPLMAAGPIAKSLGADLMTPLQRQLYIRGLQAYGQGATAAAGGAGAKDIATAVVTGAAFPTGGREAGVDARTLDQQGETLPMSRAQRVPDIEGTLATRHAAVKPVTDAQGNVLLNPEEVAQGEKPKIRLANSATPDPAHHANFETRDETGQFAGPVVYPEFPAQPASTETTGNAALGGADSIPKPANKEATLATSDSQLTPDPTIQSTSSGTGKPVPVQTNFPNVPERPETIQAQLDARGYALVPHDNPAPEIRPEDYRSVATPDGIVYFDPKRIDAETIRNTPTAELLGHVEPKSEATTQAVLARDANGNEVHASAVSPENVDAQVAKTQENFPDAQVESGGAELAQQVLDDRLGRASQGSAKRAESDAVTPKPVLDSAVVNPEELTDLVEGTTFRDHGLGGLDVESRRVVLSEVLRAIHDPEIRDVVIKLIPVDVVNNLSRVKSPSDVSLHDGSVLKDEIVPNVDNSVSVRSDVADSLVRAVAEATAKERSAALNKISLAGNGDPAVGADGIGHENIIPEEVKASYENRHGSADIPDRLLKNSRAAELFDKIDKGEANESETNEFRDLARRYGVPDEATDNAIASAASEARPEVPATGDETGSPAVSEQEAGTGDQPTGDNAGQRGDVGRVTSVKNATTTAERAERGLGPVEKELARGDQEVWGKAKRDVDSGVVNPDKLAAEVSRKPRPLDEDETAALLYRRTQLHNQREAQMSAAEEALVKGDKIKAAQHNLDIQETERLLGVNEEADVRAGTKQGRALRIRQLMAKHDFSLGAMERRARIARGGDLTAADKATIKEQHDQIAKLTTELEKIKQQQEFSLTQDAVKKIIRDEKFSARKERRTTTRKALDDDFEAIKKQLAAVWKKSPSTGIHPMGLAALDPEGIATKLVLKLAKNRIQAGHVTAEGLVDAVHERIADAVDLTKREVAEMISGYGKTFKPSDEPTEKKLRELKSIIASNLGKADVIEKGIRPLRRGYQPDKPSVEVRAAMKDLRDTLREHGIKIEKSERGAEEEQKSILDAAKTRARNRIEDLSKWIADGKRTVANKTEVIPDEELKVLHAERDRLSEIAKALDDPEADRRTVENLLRDANKSIAEKQAQIASGELKETVKGQAGPTSPALEAARAERAMLSKIVGDMRSAEKGRGPLADPDVVDANKLLTAHKALNTRLAKQALEYQRRIDEIKASGKPYEAPPKKEPFARTQAERAFEERIGRLKRQYEAENRKASLTPFDWVGRLIVGAGRAAKLTYGGTLGKLTSAATGRIITSPIEDMWGAAVGKALPGLYKGAPAEGKGSTPEAAKVAKDLYGGREGAGLLNDHIAGIERLWKSDTWKQVVSKLITGHSQQDILHGKGERETDFLGLPGRVHGTFKEPVRQVTFYRQFRRRLGQIAREGKLDINDPQVQMGAAGEAWNDAARSIFMQRNFLSDGFNNMVAGWERSGKAGPKMAAFLARLEFPITRVPVNVASEGLNYTFGLGRALGETGYRAMVGGGKGERFSLGKAFDSMTPEQKDSLMRAYKKGGLGLAMMAWGFAQPQHFGGYFQKGDKRDKDEPGFGEQMWFGHRIPKWAGHVPILEPAQIGATFRRLIDKGREQGKADATLEAAGGTAKGFVSQIPFYETPGRFFAGMEGPRQASRFAGEQVRGFVPGGIQEYAKYRDKNPQTGEPNVRTPQGNFADRFKGTIKLGIPGMRETVPLNEGASARALKEATVTKMRKGDIPDNSELASQGYSKAQITSMKNEANLSPFQETFSNVHPDKAIERYERMDERQRYQVKDQMAYKAKSLVDRAQYLLDNAKDEDKEKRQQERDTLQQRLDALGIEAQAKPKPISSGSAFKPPRVSAPHAPRL